MLVNCSTFLNSTGMNWFWTSCFSFKLNLTNSSSFSLQRRFKLIWVSGATEVAQSTFLGQCVPDATSRGPCTLRSSLTASRNSRPPAFSSAFPETTAQQLNIIWRLSAKECAHTSRSSLPTPSLRSISAFVGFMIPSTLMVPILLTSLSVRESWEQQRHEQVGSPSTYFTHAALDWTENDLVHIASILPAADKSLNHLSLESLFLTGSMS